MSSGPYKQETIDRDLAEKASAESAWQKKIVDFCMTYVKTSAAEMSKQYDTWDSNDLVYRGYRTLDKDDKDSANKGEPVKIIVPITFAQTQTALSFVFSTFTQRRVMYELLASGPEDEKFKIALETDLDYQMTNQKALFKLYMYLLDHFKYGFGVMKVDWGNSFVKMRTSEQRPVNNPMNMLSKLFGQQSAIKYETVEKVTDVLAYEGNRLTNVSPYQFYPDPSCTIANFQDGKFVAHDFETSLASVEAGEGKEFFGTDKIPATVSKDEMKDRKRRAGSTFAEGNEAGVTGANQGNNRPRVIVKTEVEFVMSEKDASRQFEGPFGSDTTPIKWLAVIANDSKLIKFQPVGYLHDKFNYALSEFSPDNNAFYNPGLSDTIFELQNLITFFLNSHVVNVKKIIQNRFIIDPNRIHETDITNNAAMIRLKQSGLPIDQIIKQLEVNDVTRQHVADMDNLIKLVQIVTGINENALGQYSQGRRSATEARSVNAGAAARLKMFAHLVWLQGLDPMGRQILSNTRQGRTKDVYNQIVGDKALEAPWEKTILADPSKIAGGYDFVPYDATLPSDKSFQANVLQELFGMMMQNPNSMQLLNKSPIKLLNHIAELYGIKNIKDYNLEPEQSLPPLQATVQTDDEVRAAQAAGAQPVPDAASLLQSLGAA
jgi:hypothetical protein